MTRFTSFADLAGILANDRIARAADNEVHAATYDGAFIEHSELAKLSIMAEPEASEMPDPDMARAAVELAVGTIFDVFRGTRMEEFAQQIVWGFVNSFHMTARIAEGREDDAAKKLGELARYNDNSEIHAVEMEDTQLLCRTLQGCREALEAMRDHASQVYRVETGKPFTATRGSQVSRTSATASQIAARDFLAARNRQRNEDHAPTGPMVVVSGGQVWHDHEMLWDILDDIKARIPEMVLATTGMRKGVDAIATGWAQARKVKSIAFVPNSAHGNAAPFKRNENLVRLRPVEAIVCEGSGIQSNLAQRLRAAGVPLHVRRIAEQRPAPRSSCA
ncbi:DUF2493 domain-containing protein [Novosphingobium sp. KN65.2]|uniref:DUF2493 domain-containing protein n=1 Tax=Novosphingobium sp. KN65.2 TaxID=1478134 RepID=UPI0005EA68DD|nr:DUF2493 domain-containing protein [Novosphingobium sp. KN65.2]CDO38615.1 conserved hypothetical protein [Novosphingobium sp. KN65.2]